MGRKPLRTLTASGLPPLSGSWALRRDGGGVLTLPEPPNPAALAPWLAALASTPALPRLHVVLPGEATAVLRYLGQEGFLPRRGRLLQRGWVSLERFTTPRLTAPSLKGAFPNALRATLLFVCRGEEVLLMEKKRGHGAGLINGPGGKLEPGESLLACALRETEEELGIRAEAPDLCAELRFLDCDGSKIHGFVYRSQGYRGVLRETSEGKPFWAKRDAVPFWRMWADDRLWLPWVLRGHRLRASFATAGSILCAGELQVDADPALGLPPEPEAARL